MKKAIAGFFVLFAISSCVTSVNSRKIIINKDASGNVTSYQVIEEQQQQAAQMPFKFKHLDKH